MRPPIEATSRPVARVLAALGLAATLLVSNFLISPSPAAAFCKLPSKWESNVWRLHVQDYVPAAWLPALQAAMNQWNNTSKITYIWTPWSPAFYNFNLDNVDFAYYGYEDDPGYTYFPGLMDPGSGWKWKPHNRADVKLNNNWTWVLDGTFSIANRKADVRTVALHEIGHATGLAHPFDCTGDFTAAEKASAMNATFTKKWVTTSDDDAGNKNIYGLP